MLSFRNINIKRQHNFYPQVAEPSAETNIQSKITYELYGLAYYFPRLNQEETDNMNRQINRNKTEGVTKKLLTNQNPGPDCFMGEFCQTFKEYIILMLKLFQNIEENRI